MHQNVGAIQGHLSSTVFSFLRSFSPHQFQMLMRLQTVWMYHTQKPKDEGCGYPLFIGWHEGVILTVREIPGLGMRSIWWGERKRVFWRKWQHQGLVSLTCIGEGLRDFGEPDWQVIYLSSLVTKHLQLISDLYSFQIEIKRRQW